ncbi:19929_t:CDS:2 [Racocetra fulgida]|uniref:19929_t:CDS:1 n=1 Tax=Racocetra fulgida TaxID=60492 RepID=A0A9N9DQC4_9GLOM|nr:19929_t:CDS:2 [Racocetra fulgida]
MQAFLNDKTQENATGAEPQVIITDMDPVMDATCKIVYPNTYHVYCIWHLSQNLPKNLKSKLGNIKYKEFICEFWQAQNSLSVDIFEQRFQLILEKYPNASDYLQNPIYSTRQLWACSFINRIFTTGMQLTQYIESINALVHKEVSSSSSMTNVAEAINSQMQKEDLNMCFIS